MPVIPAFCDSCGTPFSSGMVIENSTNITIKGGVSGPCPACGGVGRIPDGVYDIIGNSIKILSAPGKTIEQYRKLAEILREAKSKRIKPSEAVSKIESEVEGFRDFAKFVKDNETRFYNIATLLIAIISLCIDSCENKQPSIQITIEQTINQIAAESQRRDSLATEVKPPGKKPVQKVGRNEMCPCGSNKKFKKCHGEFI